MSVIRTFIAFDLTAAVRGVARRQIDALRGIAGSDYSWVDPANMHLTLKFLGNVPDNEVPDVCRVVGRAMSGFPPVACELSGVGAFPDNRRPRTLWLRIGEGTDELREMRRALDQALLELRFPLERGEFRPHVTLGRIDRNAAWNQAVTRYLDDNAEHQFGGFEVDEIIVYSSFEDRRGRTYTPMATIGLDG